MNHLAVTSLWAKCLFLLFPLFFFSFFFELLFFFYVFADMGEYFIEKSFTSNSSEKKNYKACRGEHGKINVVFCLYFLYSREGDERAK